MKLIHFSDTHLGFNDLDVINEAGINQREADFYDAFTVGKADAVLAASLFHFNEIPIESLKKYLKEKNIPVRPV